MFKKSFNSAKCKTLLRLATSRIKLLRNKRDIQLRQMKRELAKLLETNQVQSAHIRVEHIYREQNTVAAYEIIELLCDLIAARLPIVESQKHCPIDLREAISSIIFAAPRCSDIPELQKIRNMFSAKYGKEFTAVVADLRPDCGVNRVVIEKLSVRGPSVEVKRKLMKDIAAEHSVDWDSTAFESQLFKPPEDLLEGTSQFFSASQTYVQKSFSEPQTSEPITPQNQGNVVADTKTIQNTEIWDEKQFIPFVRPIVEDNNSFSGSQSTSRMAASQWQTSSSDFPSRVLSGSTSYKYDGGVDSQPVIDRRESLKGVSSAASYKYGEGEDAHERRNSLKGVAAAASAAAESAELAAAAARAAVEIVSQNFDRNISGSSSDNESDNDGNTVSQLHAGFEDKRATYRRPLFDAPAEGEGFYMRQNSGKNVSSYDRPIAGHLVSHPTFDAGGYNNDESESVLHSTSRLDDSSAYRRPLFDEPAEGEGFYVRQNSCSTSRLDRHSDDQASQQQNPGRDLPDDSSTYGRPLFDEPVEREGFYMRETSGKHVYGYDGPVAGHSVSPPIFDTGGFDNDDSTREVSMSRLDQHGDGNVSSYDAPIAGHSVSRPRFDKGGYNNDNSESVSHSTSRLDRHGNGQVSPQQVHSRNSFSNNRIFQGNNTRTRSSVSYGAYPSFDPHEWDDPHNKLADEAMQSTTGGPPERPPPKLPGAQPPTLTKTTSFVHPKLPDYDDLTAYFKGLKAMKSKK